MKPPVSSHLLVAPQFASIGMGLYPYAGQQGAAEWLIVSVIGILIALYTLLHNRLGNFAVYPNRWNRRVWSPAALTAGCDTRCTWRSCCSCWASQ